jgi:hypothetical protein
MKSAPGTGRVRCAIYTRVSTDQGLDQDCNSLDAQYVKDVDHRSNAVAITSTRISIGMTMGGTNHCGMINLLRTPNRIAAIQSYR